MQQREHAGSVESAAVAPAESPGRVGRQSLAQNEAAAGDGVPVPDGPRQKYEQTFNTSFSDVRVHTGKYAATLTDQHNATAFARGNNIYFGAGKDPADPKNSKLLAHELAHTVQQRGAPQTGPVPTTAPGDTAEREADAAADAAVSGSSAAVSSQPAAIARKGKDEKQPDEDPVEVEQFEASYMNATKFQLSKGGGLMVQDIGDKVRLQSPEITATSTATLNLPKNLKLGSKTVQVGPIQALTSSKRTGIYQKDNNTTNKTQSMGQIRDAAPVTHKDGKTTYSQKSEKGPFYSGNPDVKIHKQNVADGPGKPKDPKGEPGTADLGEFAGDAPGPVTVVMIDQPSFAVDKKLADGSVLIGTEGSDEFNTSAGFKTSNGQTFGKAPFGWRVSWARKIDVAKPEDKKDDKANKDPKNDAIQDFEVKDAIIEDGEAFAVQLANINSVEDASYRDMAWLIENLPKARTARPEAAGFMEGALGAKTVTIKVTPRKTASSETSLTAKLNLDVTPSITKMGPTRSVAAMIGQQGEITMTLGSLADVRSASLTLSQTIGIAAHEWTNGTFGRTQFLGGTCTLALPTKGSTSGTVSDGDGSYDVSVAIQ